MKVNLGLIDKYWQLLWVMTQTEFRVRYKRTLLGIFWTVFNPLIKVAVIGLVFSFFIQIPDYFIFVVSGILPWQFFAASLNNATPSFINKRSIIQKAKFPKEIIPLAVILFNFIQLVISLVIMLILLEIFQGNLTVLQVVLLLEALLWILFLTIGISFISSILNVLIKDIQFVVRAILEPWFYATPIVYNLESIPQKFQFIFKLNPLTAIFEMFHFVVIKDVVISPQIVILNLIITILVMMIAFSLFIKKRDQIADWV